MAILENNVVRIEREFNASKESVFTAISKGILFLTCGANSKSLKLEFAVGGKYELHFKEGNVSGEFKEITPFDKIVFSWSQKESVVTILLNQEGAVTRLTLTHVGISDETMAGQIDAGWRDGLNDFSPKVGKTIEVKRVFSSPVQSVFEACAHPRFFVKCGANLKTGSMDFKINGKYSYKIEGSVEGDFVNGEFTDIIPNRRIAFTWNSLSNAGPTGPTLVLIDFKDLGDGQTELKITHTGFPTDSSAKDHNEGWGGVLKSMEKEINELRSGDGK